MLGVFFSGSIFYFLATHVASHVYPFHTLVCIGFILLVQLGAYLRYQAAPNNSWVLLPGFFCQNLHMSHSLNSLKGGYIGDYIGDYYRGY